MGVDVPEPTEQQRLIGVRELEAASPTSGDADAAYQQGQQQLRHVREQSQLSALSPSPPAIRVQALSSGQCWALTRWSAL